NFGLPMKSEDYTHRIGRTGRAGRDGLAVTFAEFRDRRKIGDIEHYSKQRFNAEVIPGLEPKQRFEAPRPARAGFGGKPGRPGDRRPATGDRNGYGKHSGFGAKSFAPRDGRGFGAGAPREGGFGAPRDGGFGAPRDGGFGGGRGDFGGRGRPVR
ncbi:MAG: box helicase domain protein, partial [Ramlibacter sp.]|nr:box helicase domain protein [Ramlibacter sp.]